MKNIKENQKTEVLKLSCIGSRETHSLFYFHMQHNLYYYCYSYSCSSSIKCKRGFVARSFRSFAKGFLLTWKSENKFDDLNVYILMYIIPGKLSFQKFRVYYILVFEYLSMSSMQRIVEIFQSFYFITKKVFLAAIYSINFPLRFSSVGWRLSLRVENR